MVKMRLTRMGKKKKPFYRVVIAASNAPREGRFVEIVGHYDPMPDPAIVQFDEERTLHWLRAGAQPTETVRHLLEHAGIWQQHSGNVNN
jgi:small subunit ribosomal protein S16